MRLGLEGTVRFLGVCNDVVWSAPRLQRPYLDYPRLERPYGAKMAQNET